MLLIILAIYLLVEGTLTALTGLATIGKGSHWLLLLVEGAVALFVGWVLITTPGFAVLTLDIFIQVLALWLVLGGVLRVIMAIAVRKKIKNEVFLIISGIIAALVGIWIFMQPGIGILALVMLFGFSAIIMGIFYIAFAMRLKESKV